jgi:hypothetical protein
MSTMSPLQQLEALRRRQLVLDDGIRMLRQIRQELARDSASAQAWGQVAVLANVTIIPLNVIVNTFELGAAKAVYDVVVGEVYAELARSGTRSEGRVKGALAALKKALVETLKRKGATAYVPGVNILVGLAEDSWAAWQAVTLTQGGQGEARQLAMRLQAQIDRTQRELVRLGVIHAELLERLEVLKRTA